MKRNIKTIDAKMRSLECEESIGIAKEDTEFKMEFLDYPDGVNIYTPVPRLNAFKRSFHMLQTFYAHQGIIEMEYPGNFFVLMLTNGDLIQNYSLTNSTNMTQNNVIEHIGGGISEPSE